MPLAACRTGTHPAPSAPPPWGAGWDAAHSSEVTPRPVTQCGCRSLEEWPQVPQGRGWGLGFRNLVMGGVGGVGGQSHLPPSLRERAFLQQLCWGLVVGTGVWGSPRGHPGPASGFRAFRTHLRAGGSCSFNPGNTVGLEHPDQGAFSLPLPWGYSRGRRRVGELTGGHSVCPELSW